jgi:hypothetical protein
VTKFVIYESDNIDGPVVGCTTREGWDSAPELQLDANGRKMEIEKEFEAETWEDAMQVYYNHYGFGRHKSMEEHDPHNTPNPTAA